MLRGMSLTAVVAMVMPVVLAGQAPKMTVNSEVSPKGGFHITIHNNYSETAVTFLVGVKYAFPGPRDTSEGICGTPAMTLSSGECTRMSFDNYDSVFDTSGKGGIPPGGSKSIDAGNGSYRFGKYPDGTPTRLLDLQIGGVIFEDGTTFGDPAVVKRMLAWRQFMLQDAFDDEQILSKSLFDATMTLSGLEEIFKARLQGHISDRGPGGTPEGPEFSGQTPGDDRVHASDYLMTDRICSEVATNLKLPDGAAQPPPELLRVRVQRVISQLQEHMSALQDSKPPLQPPKVNPGVGGTRP